MVLLYKIFCSTQVILGSSPQYSQILFPLNLSQQAYRKGAPFTILYRERLYEVFSALLKMFIGCQWMTWEKEQYNCFSTYHAMVCSPSSLFSSTLLRVGKKIYLVKASMLIVLTSHGTEWRRCSYCFTALNYGVLWDTGSSVWCEFTIFQLRGKKKGCSHGTCIFWLFL